MSHMTDVKTKLKSKEGILFALAQCGFPAERVEVSETPLAMYGYDGQLRPTKAEIVVRRQFVGGSSNDLGFRREADGTWSMIISDYDRGSSNGGRYGLKWQQEIKKNVAQFVCTEKAVAKGFRVEFVKQTDGSLVGIARRG